MARSFPSADVGSDHQPVIANIKLHLKAKPKPAKVTKYDIQKLKDVHICESYASKIGGRFGPLLDLPDTDLDVEGMWEEIKSSIGDTSQKFLGNKKPKPQKPWLSSEVLHLCDERRQLKQEKNSSTTKRRRYNYLNREIKRQSKKCKDEWIQNLCKEVDFSHQASKTKQVYQTIKMLTGKQTLRMKSIKDKQGNVLTEEEKIKDRWRENYAEL